MSIALSDDQKLQNTLENILSNLKVDYGEIRAEEVTSTRVSFKGEDPDHISQPHSKGYFIRVLINGSWGIATFTDINLLKEKAKEAVEFAKKQGKGTVSLSDVDPVQIKIDPVLKKDFRQVSLKTKVDQVKKYNSLLLRTDPAIQTSNFIYSDSYLTKFFVNSQGSKILQNRPYLRLAYQAVARQNDVIETYRGSHGHQGGFEIVKGLEDAVIETSKKAVELSESPKVKGGNYTVILDPFMAGTFAHEAFGHFSEADHQYENPKLLEQMEIGKKLGSDEVTIVDDPTLENGWGNFVYDDEGVLAQKVSLITKGIITGRLHSLETSKPLNEPPNGHARADGFSSRPIIRMSNTFFVPGKHSLKKLISSTKKGILVINWTAGMTALENFTFTAQYGVMIENGKLGKMVRGVKLMGNIFETLKNIDAVTSDFAHDQGTCGKQGQSVPVGAGGGYVRIHNITVGGE